MALRALGVCFSGDPGAGIGALLKMANGLTTNDIWNRARRPRIGTIYIPFPRKNQKPKFSRLWRSRGARPCAPTWMSEARVSRNTIKLKTLS
jgi:hypothetical protein